MTITLTDGTTPLTLPDDLDWSDEYTWQQVEQSAEYALTGALVVEAATKQAGRPITLQGADDRAWIARAALDQLRAWATVPGQVLQLALRGSTRDVVFRHQDTAIDNVEQILFYSDPQAGTWYRCTLRFMEV
jgi:hypothetical protein